MANAVAEMMDVFFNGRSAAEASGRGTTGPRSGITLEQLAERRVSTIRLGKKYYRVTFEEITLTTKTKEGER